MSGQRTHFGPTAECQHEKGLRDCVPTLGWILWNREQSWEKWKTRGIEEDKI